MVIVVSIVRIVVFLEHGKLAAVWQQQQQQLSIAHHQFQCQHESGCTDSRLFVCQQQ